MSAPVFAIIGHPNEGKSSVVATLVEDDGIRISDFPGETTECRVYRVPKASDHALELIDTPGFQHPRKLLAFFRGVSRMENPAALFLREHGSNSEFHHDIELLKPLAEGAGVLYVIDGSRPPSRVDLDEMEVLRLSGRPRMALLNSKQGDSPFLEEWRSECATRFSSTREFNAHRAGFGERLALVEALRAIDQDRETDLARVADALRADRDSRIDRCARILASLVEDGSACRVQRDFSDPSREAEEKQHAVADHKNTLARIEARSWESLREVFHHRRFKPDPGADSLLSEGLFADRTWQLLGLTRKQLTVTAAVAGGGAGLALDAVFTGLTFGVLGLTGALGGAAAVWFSGDSLASLKVSRLPLGSLRVVAGPSSNPQFPFILLDRAFLYLELLGARTHARRDSDTGSDWAKQGMSAGLSPEDRAVVARLAGKAAKHGSGLNEAREAFLEFARREVASRWV